MGLPLAKLGVTRATKDIMIRIIIVTLRIKKESMTPKRYLKGAGRPHCVQKNAR